MQTGLLLCRFACSMNLFDHLKFWLGPKASSCHDQPDSLTEYERTRIQHYIKLNEPFSLSHASPVNAVSHFKKTGYAYDWYRLFNRSDRRACKFIFGDVSYITDEPSFCKSRPITHNNSNNVLLPLNTVRHLQFVNDPTPFERKKSQAVWRGAAYKPNRIEFLNTTAVIPTCDTADTSRLQGCSLLGRPIHFMSIPKQLQYKFVFAIEGNDVATNLKWAMSSKSAVIMPKPTKETWFCESYLEPNRHFIEIKSDYSDLEEVLEYFLSHPREAIEITQEANNYCEPYKDLNRQFHLGRLVAERYFSLVRDT